MAQLTGLQINPEVQESSGGSILIPEGKYKAVIVSDELTDNSQKTGKLLKMMLQIVDGQYAGVDLKDNINLTNPSKQCQDIGQGTLKRICKILNVNFPPDDTQKLWGKPLMITVIIGKPFKSQSGDMIEKNEIKSYSAVVAMAAGSGVEQKITATRGW